MRSAPSSQSPARNPDESFRPVGVLGCAGFDLHAEMGHLLMYLQNAADYVGFRHGDSKVVDIYDDFLVTTTFAFQMNTGKGGWI